MLHETTVRRWRLAAATVFLLLVAARGAHAQAFISGSYGYNFAGEAGCRSATDCRDKNWNFGGALGALGSVVGFEAELTYEGEFTGESPTQKSSVTTIMANFMLAPKFSIVQPFGLIGAGVIKTKIDDPSLVTDNAETDAGWTVGGGLIVYVNKHVGLKGDVRYYRSFSGLDLLNLDFGDLADGGNKIDFGRAAFGVVLKF